MLRKRRAKLREILQHRPVKVAFQVAQLGKWKSESVLQLMMKDPQFEPMIWIVPPGGSSARSYPDLLAREAALIHEQFVGYNIPVVEYKDIASFSMDEKPDLIFIHEAYDYNFRDDTYQGLTNELLCYIPYCFHNITDVCGFDGIGNNAALFNFYENSSMCRFGTQMAQNKGKNNVNTGAPLADIFMNKNRREVPAWKDCGRPMKKVIWAPHWSICAELSAWFVCGTFLKNAMGMVELAKQYADQIQFAFKPHPHLYRTLCRHPEWGEEKAAAFYRLWAEMPNTQLAEGEYTALFMQSDAMIHDSGSFILEYLFADKPAMFLREGQGYQGYNEMTLDALECYHKGLTKEDIDNFLQQSVLGTKDPLAETRHAMLKKYLLPPHGKTAAENIIEALKNV